MARGSRVRSNSGVYHIILKGIDDRNIFMDDFDRCEFINSMKEAKEAGSFQLIAYCLMNNHVHLLIKEDEPIGESIKRITVRYSHYYNRKNGRKGHLFNNRFKSEAVEEENYLLTVLHYIHQNPVRAAAAKYLNDYKWSSYHEYIVYFNTGTSWINCEVLNKYFENARDFGAKSEALVDSLGIDRRMYGRFDDDMIYKIVNDVSDLKSIAELDKMNMMEFVRNIKEITGGSNRQLSRVLGVGKKIVDQAFKEYVDNCETHR